MSYNSYMLKTLVQKEHIVMLLESLGASGINTKDSNGIRCSCPIHKSSGTAVFTYNPELHLYICYGECQDNQKEGDFITLVQHCQNCTYDSAIEYICDVCGIDIKLIETAAEFLLEEVKLRIDGILSEINPKESIEEDREFYYGVKPVDEEILQNFLGKKDEEGFIDSQGFKESTLELFESAYNETEKRWLLPQRSPDGLLLGFDGRDITNKKKDKWRKRAGLLKNLLLGRLDITSPYIIESNKIILCEGKKDMMAIFEADLKHVSCVYGSSLAPEQEEIIGTLIDDEIILAVDGDKAGYKLAKSIVDLCYPEYRITALEIPDGEDPADLSKKFMHELYDSRLHIEEWLQKYEYRAKQKK